MLRCIFPHCSIKLSKNDLERHIRRHLHFKQHRCSCGAKFYEPQQFFDHQEMNENHYKLPDTAEDAYMNALVYRVRKDCIDVQDREVSEITLRLSAGFSNVSCTPIQSPCGSQNRIDLSKRPRDFVTDASQEEHRPEKHGGLDFEVVFQSNGRKRVLSTGLGSSASDDENGDEKKEKKKIMSPKVGISEQMTPPPLSSICDPKTNQTSPLNSPAIVKCPSQRQRKSNIVKSSKIPHPSLKVRDVQCFLCTQKTLVKSDLETRRTHVTDVHMQSFDYSKNYKLELVYKTSRAFPDMPSDDNKCMVCYRTGNCIYTLTGRRNHVQQYHLTSDLYLTCPYPIDAHCQVVKFSRLEELNQHCVNDHKWGSYRDLEKINIKAYDAFCAKKCAFNTKCSELVSHYFPIPPSGKGSSCAEKTSTVPSSEKLQSTVCSLETPNSNGT